MIIREDYTEADIYNLTNALWLVYSHNELSKLAGHIVIEADVVTKGMLPPITGNNHPLLIELATNILRRYEEIKK
jgi:hypothetical protein